MEKDPTSRFSTAPSLLGSEDPSMLKESEDLLSQFMRCSSNESQPTPPQNPPRNMQKVSADSTTRISSPRPRIKIPRGNVQLRPHTSPRTTIQPTNTSFKAQASNKQTVVLPPSRGKRPSPPRRRTTESPSSSTSSGVPIPAVIRRSRRSRAEPTNYYEKIRIFDSESEGEARKPPKASTGDLPHRQRNVVSHATSAPSPPLPANQTTRGCNTSLSSLLRRRELGYRPDQKSHSKLASNFTLSKTWKGASNDVIALAWSPGGTRFAAGATAQCDEHMMAYNRKNNLVFGDLVSNELHELPDHWVQRPLGRGPASDVGDPRLFMSVTALQWFDDALYTASYDHTVKLWDTSRGKASCYKTLKHDSKVVVMARSNFAKNLLATGSDTIGFWNTNEAQYTKLELPWARSRKDIGLVPTSLAWGTNQVTKDYLLAGMSEKEDCVAQHGLLAAYRVREDSIIPKTFSPYSQNVFDVKWHPVLSMFAIACTAGQQASRGSRERSVVNLYEPERNHRVMGFECPAIDINEVVFCPLSANYISAGCTDGITYVWDRRNHGQILHQLEHGKPLNQLDENLERDQADTGVNMQSWGSSYDQFFTGASDGVLKRWNILRAHEDVLVEDVATFQEGIMSGALSPDRTNLLIGDVSGGVHLLSNSPFSPEDPEELEFKFKESPCNNKSEFAPGVKAAKELILSGQIVRHPVFGPGKGAKYKGPFARYARPEGTPSERIAATRLDEYYELRQLDGISPKYRNGLSITQQREVQARISLAKFRNQKRGENKRRYQGRPSIKTEPLDNGPGYEVLTKRKQRASEPKESRVIVNNVEVEVIDLTLDSDDEGSVTLTESSGATEDDLDDDFWWPDNSLIKPNWPKD
ncbi:WD40-repeat-containing domain protein [Aspergillus cavernicola]|uniref:WD40-repeat-containing domain protein n=1 Tax=Aspergillus cavernicola TaxID=176166 RepID=A0ABR4HP15_9EURO